MRRRLLIPALLSALVATALAQDSKKTPPKSPDKAAPITSGTKTDLLYRWDQLDGKVAVYETEVTSLVGFERKLADGVTDPGDVSETTVEGRTTTKQRLLMLFARGERDRGRVTLETERIEIAATQKQKDNVETVFYDSAKPDAAVPEQLRESVASVLKKPYTLTVSRRGVVEAIEGRPKSELDAMKAMFLRLPDDAKTVGQGWTRTENRPADALGILQTVFNFKLAGAVPAADASAGELRIEYESETRLDERTSRLTAEAVARIDGAKGHGRVVLDARGLKLESQETSTYQLTVSQPVVIQKNRYETESRWKLLELREGK